MSKQYCTFHIAGHYFGIWVNQVQEILRYQPMTTVPLTSPIIQGLLNLRGQIVLAIDLRQRLALPPQDNLEEALNIIVQTEDDVVSFIIDEIDDVIGVDESLFEPVPMPLRGAIGDFVLGAYKLEGKLMLALDTQKATDLVNHPTRNTRAA